ncbi:hypothetical protein HD554DRAFT_895935 [Boletus coccyginus]|nr:hypothetical protein HD554DRAFT_895935 [Boletus coccyginus]
MSSTHVHHHSLEGNNPLRGTDYMEHAPSGNQGIVDGRPEGRQPQGSSVFLDTVVDQDASADNETDYPAVQSTIPGASSRDVYKGLGVPVQGMSSKEQRHDGQPGRKRQGGGVEQFGEGVAGESGGGDGARRVGGASERHWVAGKTEFRESS